MKINDQFYKEENIQIESKLKKIRRVVPENRDRRERANDGSQAATQAKKKLLKKKMNEFYIEQQNQEIFNFALSGKELDDLNDLLEFAELYPLVRDKLLNHQNEIERAAKILIADKPSEPKVRMREALEILGLGSIRNLKAKKLEEMAVEYEKLISQLTCENRPARLKPFFYRCVNGDIINERWRGFSERPLSLTEKKIKIIEVLTKMFSLASPSATRQALLQQGVRKLPKIEHTAPTAK